jgi:2-polyprenyl-6-methoxyphenol hydroxylase-like FAD-dependent oxidoreductase/predicted DsbA family dithiol-disulfide isomerase
MDIAKTQFVMIENQYSIRKVKLIYFTDPLCSTCWIIDPYVKKLKSKYSAILDIEVKMGGLLNSWEQFCLDSNGDAIEYICGLWENETKKHGMLMDSSIWRKNPISSSRPASISYYAALMQDKDKASKYIRTIREMLFLQGKDVSQRSTLITAAIQNNLDIELFIKSIEDGSAEKLFEDALEDKEKWEVTSYPTFIFVKNEIEFEKGITIGGEHSLDEIFTDWERILFMLTDGDPRKIEKSKMVLETLKKYERLSFSEIVVLSCLSKELVKRELNHIVSNGLVIHEVIGSIDYYKINNTPFSFKDKGLGVIETSVLGGGVCGGYLSIALKKIGAPHRVIERQTKESFKGFGFLMLKNGIDALDAVGLKNELFKRSNSINFFEAITPNGELLAKKVLSDCLAIRRDSYFEMIENQMGENFAEFGVEATEIINTDNNLPYKVRLSDNSINEADLFLCSDGIRSKFRGELFSESKLTPLSEREIVGMSYIPDLEVEQDSFLKVIDIENGRFMGMLPLGDCHYLWFIQLNQETHPLEVNNPETIQRYSEEVVAEFPVVFKRLIKNTDFNKVFFWTANRMDLLPAFHTKNILLLGDAAHPLLPFTSQGANSALEDAAYILTLLSNQQLDESMEDLFQRFYEIRKDAIQHHINEGDSLLEDFLNLTKVKKFKLPLSIH